MSARWSMTWASVCIESSSVPTGRSSFSMEARTEAFHWSRASAFRNPGPVATSTKPATSSGWSTAWASDRYPPRLWPMSTAGRPAWSSTAVRSPRAWARVYSPGAGASLSPCPRRSQVVTEWVAARSSTIGDQTRRSLAHPVVATTGCPVGPSGPRVSLARAVPPAPTSITGLLTGGPGRTRGCRPRTLWAVPWRRSALPGRVPARR